MVRVSQFLFDYGPFKNGEDASVLDNGAYVYIVGDHTNVGTYTIIPASVSDTNYTPSYVNGTLTKTKATVNVMATANSRMYGDANPTLAFTYGAFKNSETAATVIDTPPTALTTATNTTNVGTATITVSGGTDNNYDFTYTSADLTINKAPLTANAIYKDKVYGDANPVFDILYGGFKNGETASVLDTTPIASCTATTSTNVSSVTIDVSAGSDNNYTITSISGILDIEKATLTATADDKTKIFGEDNPVFTISYSGFKNSETLAVIDTAPVVS